MYKISTIAFDLGGVLAYQDLTKLTSNELFLLKTYLRKIRPSSREIMEEAKSKIQEIYLKIYKLNNEAIYTLEMLREYKIRPSIWTNNIREIDAWFESINLYRYIEYKDIINSIDIGFDKPDVNYYLKALAILNNMPGEVLFLDDNHTNLLSAEKCGINTMEYDINKSLKKCIKKIIKRSIL